MAKILAFWINFLQFKGILNLKCADFDTKNGGKKCILYTGVNGIIVYKN